MKRILLLISAISAFAASALAQEGVAANEVLGFLRFERSAARAGVAGAGAASQIGGSAFAAFGNPVAAGRGAGKIEAGASYGIWAPDINSSTNIAAGASIRLAEGFALSAGYFSGMFAELDLGDTSYAPKDIVLAAGLALALGESFSLGASLNYAKEQLLEDYSYSGVAADVLLSFNGKSLGVTAGVRSLGGKVSDSSLPASAMAAASWSLSAGSVAVSAVADADYYFSGNWSAAAGIEATTADLVHIRAGYRLSSGRAVLPSHLSLGAGLSLGPCTLDIAYLLASETLGGSFVAGLSARF